LSVVDAVVERGALNVIAVQNKGSYDEFTDGTGRVQTALLTIAAANIVTRERILTVGRSQRRALEALIVRLAKNIRTGASARNANFITVDVVIATIATAAIVGLALLDRGGITVN